MSNWSDVEIMIYSAYDYFCEWIKKSGQKYMATADTEWNKAKRKANIEIQYRGQYIGAILFRANGIKVATRHYSPHNSYPDYYFSEWSNANLFEEIKEFIIHTACFAEIQYELKFATEIVKAEEYLRMMNDTDSKNS